jgi:hypothetical protein
MILRNWRGFGSKEEKEREEEEEFFSFLEGNAIHCLGKIHVDVMSLVH